MARKGKYWCVTFKENIFDKMSFLCKEMIFHTFQKKKKQMVGIEVIQKIEGLTPKRISVARISLKPLLPC